jgi:hypothetical protein
LFRRDEGSVEPEPVPAPAPATAEEIAAVWAHEPNEHALQARTELLRLLRERGARSALVVYDGGNDEGAVTAIRLSREPLGVDPSEWTMPDLAPAEEVAIDDDATDDLYDAALWVVAGKWRSFAGLFFVKGRLVVDVDSGRIARHDDVWAPNGHHRREPPSEPPDVHQVDAA